jgi:hypothetical protein
MTRLTKEQIDAMSSGYELDALVAEKVMGEIMPTAPHDQAHLEPIKSSWRELDMLASTSTGISANGHPLRSGSDLMAAWKIVSRFEPCVCRFQSADGFIHLTCGHWADHGNCIEHRWTEEEEKLEDDPEAWSFHIHLGLLAEGDESPAHWKHGDRFCAFAYALYLNGLKAIATSAQTKSQVSIEPQPLKLDEEGST